MWLWVQNLMMTWLRGTPTTRATTMEQAKTKAQQCLTTNYHGTTIGQVKTLHGYYHASTQRRQHLRDGNRQRTNRTSALPFRARYIHTANGSKLDHKSGLTVF